MNVNDVPFVYYNPVEAGEYNMPYENIPINEATLMESSPNLNLDNLKLKSYQNTENPFQEPEENNPISKYEGFNYFDRFLPNEIVNRESSVEEKVSNNDMVTYFVNKGLTYNQARGLVGNLLHESGGGIHNILQGGKRGSLKIDGITGYGLAQWTSKDRQIGLRNFTGTYTPSKKQQLDYVWHELNNGYSKVLEKLKKTKTIEEATRVIMDGYERPDKRYANYGSRLKFARNV